MVFSVCIGFLYTLYFGKSSTDICTEYSAAEKKRNIRALASSVRSSMGIAVRSQSLNMRALGLITIIHLVCQIIARRSVQMIYSNVGSIDVRCTNGHFRLLFYPLGLGLAVHNNRVRTSFSLHKH